MNIYAGFLIGSIKRRKITLKRLAVYNPLTTPPPDWQVNVYRVAEYFFPFFLSNELICHNIYFKIFLVPGLVSVKVIPGNQHLPLI